MRKISACSTDVATCALSSTAPSSALGLSFALSPAVGPLNRSLRTFCLSLSNCSYVMADLVIGRPCGTEIFANKTGRSAVGHGGAGVSGLGGGALSMLCTLHVSVSTLHCVNVYEQGCLK